MKVGAKQAGLPVTAITNPTPGILEYPNAPGYPPDLAPDPSFMDLPDYAPSPGEYQYVRPNTDVCKYVFIVQASSATCRSNALVLQTAKGAVLCAANLCCHDVGLDDTELSIGHVSDLNA